MAIQNLIKITNTQLHLVIDANLEQIKKKHFLNYHSMSLGHCVHTRLSRTRLSRTIFSPLAQINPGDLKKNETLMTKLMNKRQNCVRTQLESVLKRH